VEKYRKMIKKIKKIFSLYIIKMRSDSKLGKSAKRSHKTPQGRSSNPSKTKYYPNSKKTCAKRGMKWHQKSKRCTLTKR
jgi:hypothetical protein